MIATLATAGLIALGFAVAAYVIVFPVQPFRGPLPAITPSEIETADRLRRHVEAVASRPHNLAHYRELERSASYIEATLTAIGYTAISQEFVVDGRPVRNIEVILPARQRAEGGSPAPALVIGAHYDSPDDSPGANDNGTGVAALLEIARALADTRTQLTFVRDVRLVFFVNEEAPYGKTDAMGSLRHARALRQGAVPVLGMIALETLGHFTDTPGSQRYPAPFSLVYPDRGNFVAFVGLPGARHLVGRCVRSFRSTTAFPAIGGVAPGFVPGVDLSDHWAYHQCGFPALMVTDTAPFRNPHYHRTTDLPDTVDYPSLARVTAGLVRMIGELAR